MFSEETTINKDSLIAAIWKWQIVIFWMLAIYVVFGPAGNPKDTFWYINVSLSISLVVVCFLLVLFGLSVVVIKRQKLGFVKILFSVLALVLFNVPGSMVLYLYIKNNRIIGKA